MSRSCIQNVLALGVLALVSACSEEPRVDADIDTAVESPAETAGMLSARVLSSTPLGPKQSDSAWRSMQEALPESAADPAGALTARLTMHRQAAESRSLQLVVGAGEKEIAYTAEAINVGDMAWAPDGRWLALCEGTLVSVVDVRTAEKRTLYTGPGGPYPGTCRDLQWSADGLQLSFIQFEHADYADLANPRRIVLAITQGGTTP